MLPDDSTAPCCFRDWGPRPVATTHFRMEQSEAVLSGWSRKDFGAVQRRSVNSLGVLAMQSQNQSALRRSHSRSIGSSPARSRADTPARSDASSTASLCATTRCPAPGLGAWSCRWCCRPSPRKPGESPQASRSARSPPARNRRAYPGCSQTSACLLRETADRSRNTCWSDHDPAD